MSEVAERSLEEQRAAEADEAARGDTPPAPSDPPADPPMEGEDEVEPVRLPEVSIDGDGQLSLKVGGAKPDEATVKLRSVKIAVIDGQYEKGDAVNLMVKAVCTEVHFVDKRDEQTGTIVGVERRQIFRPLNVERVI